VATVPSERIVPDVPMTRSKGDIYEYACHEGNYAMSNILSGERAKEREAQKKQ